MKNNFGNFKNENEFLKSVKNAINFRKQRNIEKKLFTNCYINLLEYKKDSVKHFQVIVKKINGNIIYIKGYSKPFTLNVDKLIRGKQVFQIKDVSKFSF